MGEGLIVTVVISGGKLHHLLHCHLWWSLLDAKPSCPTTPILLPNPQLVVNLGLWCFAGADD
jgi:hypothetical protein